jgi:hypothetical protein
MFQKFFPTTQAAKKPSPIFTPPCLFFFTNVVIKLFPKNVLVRPSTRLFVTLAGPVFLSLRWIR